MTFTHSQVPALRKYIHDVEHDLCAVLIGEREGDGYAFAVCDTETGEILAWDGMYFDSDDRAPSTTRLDADWDGWEDMPSKLLIATQSRWASERMTGWLMPTFSPARAAGRLVDSWAAKNGEMNPAVLHGAVFAYLPIVDRDVFEAARAGQIVG